MKIAFCGHSHHRTTGSSAFLRELLRERAELVDFWFEGWRTGEPFDASPLTSGEFDAVVVWQVEPVARQLAAARVANVTFFPMYDGCHAMPDSYWRALEGLKVVCFSSTLHERVQRLGVRSRFVRYAPEPGPLGEASAAPELAGYFWQRQQDVTWATIRRLLGDARFGRFTLHAALDPSQGELVAPSGADASRYALRTTSWFATRDEATADLRRHNVYFAPRLREGIGLSFLEAMAMGFLVVAPDHPTMNEYIVSGVNGLLYDPAHPRPLDFSRHAELGVRARRTVELASASWRRCTPALLDFVLTPAAAVPVAAPLDSFDPLALAPAARGAGAARSDGAALPTTRVAGPSASPGRLEGGRRLRAGSPRDPGPEPLVTIAVVTRDAASRLSTTLDSLLRQDLPLPHRELVVLDRGSRDGTLDLLRAHDDAIDLWRSAPDDGPWAAWNAAAAAARGRWVLLLDAGDTLHSTDALSRALEDAPAGADAIVGHHVHRLRGGDEELRLAADLDESWSRLREGRIDLQWLTGLPARQATLLRTEWLRANPYRADLGDTAQDDLLHRLAAGRGRVHHSLAILAACADAGLSRLHRERRLAARRCLALEHTDAPAAVAAGFDAIRTELRRVELPRLGTAQVLLRVGRVPGAWKEARRRLKGFLVPRPRV
jgi:glycosyl transferase family 2/glycosyl transferase family 1